MDQSLDQSDTPAHPPTVKSFKAGEIVDEPVVWYRCGICGRETPVPAAYEWPALLALPHVYGIEPHEKKDRKRIRECDGLLARIID